MKTGRPKNHIKASYIVYCNGNSIEVYHLDAKGHITLKNGKIVPEIHEEHESPTEEKNESNEWIQEFRKLKLSRKYLNSTLEANFKNIFGDFMETFNLFSDFEQEQSQTFN